MVAARIQGPFVVAACSQVLARIAPSSQGDLAMLAILHSPMEGTAQMPSCRRSVSLTPFGPKSARGRPKAGQRKRGRRLLGELRGLDPVSGPRAAEAKVRRRHPCVDLTYG